MQFLYAASQSRRQRLGRAGADRSHRQGWVDAVAGWEGGRAEDVQPGRVMHSQVGAEHRLSRILAHAAASQLVAADHAGEARPAPCLTRADCAESLRPLFPS